MNGQKRKRVSHTWKHWIIKSDRFLSSFASICIFVTRFFCKILIKTRISYIFTSTNVCDVHVVCVSSDGIVLYSIFAVFIFSNGRVKNGRDPRQWKRPTCHDTWELFCFFVSHYYFGKDERQKTDHIRLHCATWHFYSVIFILVKLFLHKWKKIFISEFGPFFYSKVKLLI